MVSEAFATLARRASIGAPTSGLEEPWAESALSMLGGWQIVCAELRGCVHRAGAYRNAWFVVASAELGAEAKKGVDDEQSGYAAEQRQAANDDIGYALSTWRRKSD